MLKWDELVSNSCGIEVNNRTFRPQGPSSAVTLQCVTAEEGLQCPKVLLLTSMPCEMLTNSPHFKFDVAMSFYNIMETAIFNAPDERVIPRPFRFNTVQHPYSNNRFFPLMYN